MSHPPLQAFSMTPYGLQGDSTLAELQLASSAFAVGPQLARAADPVPGAKPLSVAHLGPCLFRGGAEQQLIDLHHFFDPSQVVLTKCLVTNSNAIDPRVAADLKCPVLVATTEELARTATENDILLFWGLKLDELLPKSDAYKAKCVYLAHGDSWWTKELLDGSRGMTTHTIAVSQRVVEETCDHVPHTKIHNGVDTARLATTRSRDEMRASLGFEPEDFVVGFVGRFSPEKRPELLIESLSRLPRHYKALFVGWGTQRQELMDKANRLIPNRYAFAVADQYLGDYYQSMDAFSLLSVQEGFAMVLIEAMFSGLPIVATSVGAVPEVMVDRVNGLVVDGTSDQISRAVSLLQERREWAASLGREARRYACQFGHARRMALDYQNLLTSLCRQGA
ncbi:glycosyltransferase family 4 protein [Schlesneria sp. DSM 10557]|uniref:glycosyltransferase family 4 protein n=1 Tax=Schlesneria sp. DSM 10557 TaxID=3044399 RepID=UPI0035A078E2